MHSPTSDIQCLSWSQMESYFVELRLTVCSLIVIWSCSRSLISCARIWQVASAGCWGRGGWRGTSTPKWAEVFHVCQRREAINMYFYVRKEAGISDVVHRPVLSWLPVLPFCKSGEVSRQRHVTGMCRGNRDNGDITRLICELRVTWTFGGQL